MAVAAAAVRNGNSSKGLFAAKAAILLVSYAVLATAVSGLDSVKSGSDDSVGSELGRFQAHGLANYLLFSARPESQDNLFGYERSSRAKIDSLSGGLFGKRSVGAFPEPQTVVAAEPLIGRQYPTRFWQRVY